MKQKLKALSQDIPIISDYLHDSFILIDSVAYDKSAGVFSMRIERISYENGKKGKKLGIIPVIRYPKIKSQVQISGVTKMDMEWLDDAFKDDEGYPHQFLSMSQDENGSVIICSDMFKVTLSRSNDLEVVIEDLSEPSEMGGTVDFGKSIFIGNEEINKLRI